jgi:hypothetical protein
MKLSASPYTLRLHAALVALGLFAALGLGACSRSTHIAQSIAGPTREAVDATANANANVNPAAKPQRIAPDVPVLAAPANGATDVSLNPTLSWNAAAGAASYQVQVATDAGFSTRIMDKSGMSGTSTSVTGLTAGSTYFWRVRARSKNLTSAFSSAFSFSTAAAAPPPGGGGGNPPPPPPVSTDPCASLTGLGGAVVASAADVPQFRIDRLRIEVTGDVTAGTIDAMGPCTSVSPIRDSFISGTGDVHISGSGASGTATGKALSFGALLTVPGEDGVVLATDAAGNVLEIIWPALAGLGAGQPILRLQLQSYSSAVQAGVSIDADMTFVARAPDGTTATFTVQGRNMVVPPLK